MNNIDVVFGDISNNNKMLMTMDIIPMTNWVLSLATTTITLCNKLRIDARGDGYDNYVYSFEGISELDENIHEYWDGNHDACVCCMLDNNVRVLKSFVKAISKNNNFEYTHLLQHLGRGNKEPQYMLIVKALEAFQKIYDSICKKGSIKENFCEYNKSFIESFQH